MFSVYSLRLYFRLLYTSWQHVDRRHHYICLISFGSTRSEEEEKKEEDEKKKRNIHLHICTNHSLIHVLFFLSFSLTLFSTVTHFLFSDFISSIEKKNLLFVHVDIVIFCFCCFSFLLFVIQHRHRAHLKS